jgi:hypothetical protein
MYPASLVARFQNIHAQGCDSLQLSPVQHTLNFSHYGIRGESPNLVDFSWGDSADWIVVIDASETR